MRAILYLSLLFVVISKAVASDNGWTNYLSQAEESLAANNLDSARKDLVKALNEANKDNNLHKGDAAVEELFSDMDAWRQKLQKKSIEQLKSDDQEWRAKCLESQRKSQQELQERNLRWQRAKNQGKTFKQFDQEEHERLKKDPSRYKEFQTTMSECRSKMNKLLADTKSQLELYQIAATVRNKLYGNQDAKAQVYKKEVEADQASLQRLSQMLIFYSEKNPDVLMQKGMGAWPPDIFKSAFLTPIADISELKGGGALWLDDEIWVRFKARGPVVLQEQIQFSKIPIEIAQKRFLDLIPADKAALSDNANLECIQKKSGKRHWIWLLYNKKVKIYWYRYSDFI